MTQPKGIFQNHNIERRKLKREIRILKKAVTELSERLRERDPLFIDHVTRELHEHINDASTD